MFISVVLPAPFSPSSARIPPGSTGRSTASLATRLPKLLVIPRNSSFTAASLAWRPACLASGPGPLARLVLGLHRVLGRRDYLASRDLRSEGPELSLQRGRDLGRKVVERCEERAAVDQRAPVSAAGEGALGRAPHGGPHPDREAL